jgi:hypothetical protein
MMVRNGAIIVIDSLEQSRFSIRSISHYVLKKSLWFYHEQSCSIFGIFLGEDQVQTDQEEGNFSVFLSWRACKTGGD